MTNASMACGKHAGLRNTQRPACFPHSSEAFSIYFIDRPRQYVLAQVESQRFENLQSECSHLVGPNNLIRLKLAVSRLIGALPPRLRKRQEAVWMRRLKFLNCFIQSFPHSTGEVDHDADVLPIHEGEYRLNRGGVLHHFADANSVCIFRDSGEMG